MEKHKEVFFYFMRLGCLGFGGPLAIVSNIQDDLVLKRKWIEQSDFNAVFSLIKAMPGPVAFMTSVFMGRHRAGFWGGLLAGFGIVFPAFVLMIMFSLFFSSISSLSNTKAFMTGMQVSALGVILGSLKGLVKNNIKDVSFWTLVVISGAINYFYPSIEALIIIAFGLMLILLKKYKRGFYSFVLPAFVLSEDVLKLSMVCLKAGALVFGTGLAIVPMLEHDVVAHYHWLTHSEFLDALAFGQMTPGPVVITATYIGHKIGGLVGAVLATISIFAAAFFHMSTWFPHIIGKLKGKAWINDFVFGAVAAVVGPIIVTVIKMGAGIELNFFLISLVIGTFLLALSNKVPFWLLIPLGGILQFTYKLALSIL